MSVTRKSQRILVIEDELDTAQTLAVLFKGMGHELEFAISASAALECAQRFRPSVVLIDLLLPDGDGCDLAHTLKQDAALPGLTVIAMTGFGSEQLRRRALKSGCDAYLQKPVDLAAVDALVRSVPSRKTAAG